MVNGKSDLIDVELEPRMSKEKAQAFFAGELDGNDREIWIWLPLSKIEIGEIKNSLATVTMPEWLAKDKDLI